MIDHKDSSGALCSGCPDTCEQKDRTIVVGGVAHTGCCAMLTPHGTYEFDDDGNVTREPYCCAGKDCADETPQGCDAHAPNGAKGHVVEVIGRFPRTPFLEQKSKALVAKVQKAIAPFGTPDRQVGAGGDIDVDAESVSIRVTALEKRTNPVNGDEWHHVKPTAAEVATVRAALGMN